MYNSIVEVFEVDAVVFIGSMRNRACCYEGLWRAHCSILFLVDLVGNEVGSFLRYDIGRIKRDFFSHLK